MNLLNLLTSAFTSSSSTSALSGKTGLSKKQIYMIVAYALPLLLKYLTKNANSKEGASSLASALTQHKSTKSVETQIENADVEDGAKIINHILGNQSSEVISQVAKETQASPKEVSSVLAALAPALLSGVSSATAQANKQKQSGIDLSDGLDVNDMVGMFKMMTSAGKTEQKTENKYDGTQLLGVLTSLLK